MGKYSKPEVKTFSAPDLLEVIGPIQTQYGSANVLGGGSAQLNNNHYKEYRYVKADINYGIVTKKEVSHA